jgi:hypothetical protein
MQHSTAQHTTALVLTAVIGAQHHGMASPIELLEVMVNKARHTAAHHGT